MASKRFIREDELNDDFKGTLYYAFEDGDLASRRWLLLSDDGEECKHLDENCGCSWYHFNQLKVENGKLKGGAIIDGEQEVSNEGYCLFDAQGKLVIRDWCEEKDPHYYDGKGFRVTNKWLPIDGYWYQFNASGKVVAYAEISGEGDPVVSVGTPSDAPYRTVAEVNPVEDTVEVLVGESKDIAFKVELASDSNAQSDEFVSSAHDMRLRYSGNGSVSGVQVADKTKGICKVTFTAGLTEESGQIIVYIDDTTSKPVTIKTVLSKKNDEVKAEDVNEALDNIFSADAAPSEAVDGLKNIYSADDDKVKEEVQNQLLKDENKLKELDDKYAEEKRISKPAPAVSDKVKDVVGDVTITGSALNAEPGDTVQLNVDAASDDDWSLEGNYVNTVAFDISLFITKADGAATPKAELEIPVVITMKLPAGFTADNLQLFNIHDDGTVEVAFKILSGGRIQFVTDRFSTYVFAQKPETDNPEKPDDPNTPVTPDKPNNGGNSSGGSGGGSRSSGGSSRGSNYSQMGTWKQDANGWWISLNDGTYPVNTWKYIDCNGVYKWYRFNEAGYMVSGWFTDVDGHIYYLNPVSDGLMGSMLTGWQLIDGVWYYFNTVSDGTQGALFVNTTTPDGYVVNEKGQWIQ